MVINIKDRDIELKYSFRALMFFENITGKSFNPKTVSDMIIFFYSVVLSSSNKSELLFDDFVAWLDENPNAINEFSEWLTNTFSTNKMLEPELKKKSSEKEVEQDIEKN